MKVVTICGSMKFANEMSNIAVKLAKENGWCILQSSRVPVLPTKKMPGFYSRKIGQEVLLQWWLLKIPPPIRDFV